ncbi:hypothetical protein PWT90_06821 [Aphanocladium album]|nr:hypothetical protein PWT90_06821 [Aphanocladium album]
MMQGPTRLGSRPSPAQPCGPAQARNNAPRQRTWAPKTKTGCVTCRNTNQGQPANVLRLIFVGCDCRRRRVKCDEVKPACMRCASGGRFCEGYDQNSIDSSAFSPYHSASRAASGSSNTESSEPASRSLMLRRPRAALGPRGVETNLADMTMFDTLRFHVAGLVAGGFDHTFWTVDVLRASQVQPAIWHACLALAAMHQAQRRQAVETYRRARHEKLSMTHSTAAIQHVIALTRQKQLSGAERETLLLASLLLTALSTMQGDLPQALMHAGNGIQLFHQWRLWEQHRSSATRRGSMLNSDSIGAIIAHFELQLLSRLKHIAVPPWGAPGAPPRCSDIPFSSATDAYHEFQPLFTSLVGLWQYADMGLDAQPLPEVDIRLPYLVEFKRWKVKFDALRASGSAHPADQESMMTLYFHWNFIHVGLKANLTAGELAFDEFLPIFKDVVVEATELLQVLRNRTGSDTDARPAFSFTMSVVEGLFWAGHGCRDPATRRDILHLIRVWPRREGIWDNALMASMLETSIWLEENAWHCSAAPQYMVATSWESALYFAATVSEPPLQPSHHHNRIDSVRIASESRRPSHFVRHNSTDNSINRLGSMRFTALLSALCAATLAAATPRTAHIYVQPVQGGSGSGKPHPLAEVAYDVAAPSTAEVLTYEAPDLPDGTAAVRVGVYDVRSKAWSSGTTVASADNFSKGFSPNFLVSTDAHGDVVSVALKGVQIDAGHTRNFGPKIVLLPETPGTQPALNKPVVLNPEGKREEVQEKTLLQKYWWVGAIVLFMVVSGGGDQK